MNQFEIELTADEAVTFDKLFWQFVTAELSERPIVTTRLTSYSPAAGVERRVVRISDECQLRAFKQSWSSAIRS